ncbi:hypothetical protein U4U44_08015, partial [Klebsiella pneumoniae]
RLNRGGDRAANSALHIIAIGRLRTDAKTKEYVARRVAEGHTKMGNDSNLLIVFYVQIMPDDLVMQLHRF